MNILRLTKLFKKDGQFPWLECRFWFSTVEEMTYRFFLDRMMLT